MFILPLFVLLLLLLLLLLEIIVINLSLGQSSKANYLYIKTFLYYSC